MGRCEVGIRGPPRRESGAGAAVRVGGRFSKPVLVSVSAAQEAADTLRRLRQSLPGLFPVAYS